MTTDEAVRWIKEYSGGRIFAVQVVKRTTGELRTMRCRVGVRKYVTGAGLKFDPEERGLIGVFEMVGEGSAYKFIAREGLRRLEINGRWVDVTPVQRELFPCEGPYA